MTAVHGELGLRWPDAEAGRVLVLPALVALDIPIILPMAPFHLDDIVPIPLNQTGNSWS